MKTQVKVVKMAVHHWRIKSLDGRFYRLVEDGEAKWCAHGWGRGAARYCSKQGAIDAVNSHPDLLELVMD